MKLYNEIYNEIQNTIKTLGIASGIVGRTYISSAVMLAIRQPWRIQAVTKYLYPKLAKLYNVTWSRIERNIRYGINTAWNREKSGMHKILGFRPTSRELIVYIADTTMQKFPGYMKKYAQIVKPTDETAA